jgi:RHS repeat-associated protein
MALALTGLGAPQRDGADGSDIGPAGGARPEATQASYDYDVYGRLMGGKFERVSDLGYTGKKVDPVTGWYNSSYRDYSPMTMRFTTVDPARAGNNHYMYVDGDPVNNVDPLGLWTFNGDGTATAEPGDTLWGLSQQVTGSGSNWTDITGHSGAPASLQIGETVNYVAMTTTIDVNVYIVQGSGTTQAQVEEQMRQATITYNSQGVPVTFDANIQTIQNQTTTGASLLNLNLSDAAVQAAAAANPQGTTTAGTNVNLVGTQGGAINMVYTNTFTGSSSGDAAYSWEANNAILMTTTANAYRDIAAHELVHQFGVPDQYTESGLLSYGWYNTQTGTTIPVTDGLTISQHVQNEWTRPSPGGPVPGGSGPSGASPKAWNKESD